MDSTLTQQVVNNVVVSGDKNKEKGFGSADLSMVDPFLVEALQNPRHRLTILRMELDIQKFMQNPDLQQFEFQSFSTSYLRLAAHRVAQHYGLQTLVRDTVVDGQGIRILVTKNAEAKFPAVCLSDIPAKQSENEKHEQIKIVLKQRPSKASSIDNNELGLKRNSVRTVEERKEEYDRARARIFKNPGSSESVATSAQTASDRKELCLNADNNEGLKDSLLDFEKIISGRENGTSSRVAIFRDREKDRIDPDYDRSYERYIKNIPTTQSFSLTPFKMQPLQPLYVPYGSGFHQLNQMPRAQASMNYRSPIVSPLCLNQTSNDTVHMQWPIHSMMYAQSYNHLRQAVFQAPLCQQPLSFYYNQHHS